MRAWGCITAKGNILPRSIRQTKPEAELMLDAEPLARMVVLLDIRIDQGWAEREMQDMLARRMEAGE